MSNQLYTTASIYVNDQQLMQATSVSIKVDGHYMDQKTLALGWAGVSKGAMQIDVSVSNGILDSGFELDITGIIRDVLPVTLTVFMAGSALTMNGVIKSGSLDKAVDSDAKLSFEFTSGEAVFE